MKRLSTLLVMFVVLVLGYVGLRWYARPASFEPPTALRFEALPVESIDEVRLVFGDGKQIDVRESNGEWRIDDAPANAQKIEDLIASLKNASVTSRVSGNKQYHERFEVDGKGVRLTMLENDQVKTEMIVGKTAGGEAVYVRLPDQDDVYVMNGFPRYALNEDPSFWRDRALASFTADQVRRVTYNENQINWDLVNTTSGWTLGTNRIAAQVVDTDKVTDWLRSFAQLGASDFPSKQDVENARSNRSTFATAVIEVGTVDTFERKETWNIYSNGGETYLVVRDSDGIGFNVPAQNIDDVLSDYGAMRSKFTLTEEEKAAAAEETNK